MNTITNFNFDREQLSITWSDGAKSELLALWLRDHCQMPASRNPVNGQRLLNITDSRFQAELLEFARKHGKLERDYSIPPEASNNTPQRLQQVMAPLYQQGLLPDYPFGTDLTEQEVLLAASLRKIKALSEEPTHFIASAFKALLHHGDEDAARPFLERVHLEHPETTRDFLVQQLLMLELEERGVLKVS